MSVCAICRGLNDIEFCERQFIFTGWHIKQQSLFNVFQKPLSGFSCTSFLSIYSFVVSYQKKEKEKRNQYLDLGGGNKHF